MASELQGWVWRFSVVGKSDWKEKEWRKRFVRVNEARDMRFFKDDSDEAGGTAHPSQLIRLGRSTGGCTVFSSQQNDFAFSADGYNYFLGLKYTEENSAVPLLLLLKCLTQESHEEWTQFFQGFMPAESFNVIKKQFPTFEVDALEQAQEADSGNEASSSDDDEMRDFVRAYLSTDSQATAARNVGSSAQASIEAAKKRLMRERAGAAASGGSGTSGVAGLKEKLAMLKEKNKAAAAALPESGAEPELTRRQSIMEDIASPQLDDPMSPLAKSGSARSRLDDALKRKRDKERSTDIAQQIKGFAERLDRDVEGETDAGSAADQSMTGLQSVASTSQSALDKRARLLAKAKEARAKKLSDGVTQTDESGGGDGDDAAAPPAALRELEERAQDATARAQAAEAEAEGVREELTEERRLLDEARGRARSLTAERDEAKQEAARVAGGADEGMQKLKTRLAEVAEEREALKRSLADSEERTAALRAELAEAGGARAEEEGALRAQLEKMTEAAAAAAALEAQLAEERTRREATQTQLEQAGEEVQAKERALEEARGQATGELEAAAAKLAEAVAEGEAHAKEAEEAAAALAAKSDELTAARTELPALQEALQAKREELAASAEKEAAAASEVETLQQKLEETKGEVAELSKGGDQVAMLEEKVTRLEDEVTQAAADAAAALAAAKSEAEALQSELEEAKAAAAEAETLREQAASFEEQQEAAAQAAADAAAALAAAASEKETLQQKLEGVKGELEELSKGGDQVAMLEEKATRLEAERETAVQEAADAAAALAAETEASQAKSEELAAAAEKEAAAASEVETLQQKLEETKGEVEELSQGGDQVAMLGEKVASLESQLAAAREESDALRREAEAAKQARLGSLVESTSNVVACLDGLDGAADEEAKQHLREELATLQASFATCASDEDRDQVAEQVRQIQAAVVASRGAASDAAPHEEGKLSDMIDAAELESNIYSETDYADQAAAWKEVAKKLLAEKRALQDQIDAAPTVDAATADAAAARSAADGDGDAVVAAAPDAAPDATRSEEAAALEDAAGALREASAVAAVVGPPPPEAVHVAAALAGNVLEAEVETQHAKEEGERPPTEAEEELAAARETIASLRGEVAALQDAAGGDDGGGIDEAEQLRAALEERDEQVSAGREVARNLLHQKKELEVQLAEGRPRGNPLRYACRHLCAAVLAAAAAAAADDDDDDTAAEAELQALRDAAAPLNDAGNPDAADAAAVELAHAAAAGALRALRAEGVSAADDGGFDECDVFETFYAEAAAAAAAGPAASDADDADGANEAWANVARRFIRRARDAAAEAAAAAAGEAADAAAAQKLTEMERNLAGLADDVSELEEQLVRERAHVTEARDELQHALSAAETERDRLLTQLSGGDGAGGLGIAGDGTDAEKAARLQAALAAHLDDPEKAAVLQPEQLARAEAAATAPLAVDDDEELAAQLQELQAICEELGVDESTSDAWKSVARQLLQEKKELQATLEEVRGAAGEGLPDGVREQLEEACEEAAPEPDDAVAMQSTLIAVRDDPAFAGMTEEERAKVEGAARLQLDTDDDDTLRTQAEELGDAMQSVRNSSVFTAGDLQPDLQEELSTQETWKEVSRRLLQEKKDLQAALDALHASGAAAELPEELRARVDGLAGEGPLAAARAEAEAAQARLSEALRSPAVAEEDALPAERVEELQALADMELWADERVLEQLRELRAALASLSDVADLLPEEVAGAVAAAVDAVAAEGAPAASAAELQEEVRRLNEELQAKRGDDDGAEATQDVLRQIVAAHGGELDAEQVAELTRLAEAPLSEDPEERAAQLAEMREAVAALRGEDGGGVVSEDLAAAAAGGGGGNSWKDVARRLMQENQSLRTLLDAASAGEEEAARALRALAVAALEEDAAATPALLSEAPREELRGLVAGKQQAVVAADADSDSDADDAPPAAAPVAAAAAAAATTAALRAAVPGAWRDAALRLAAERADLEERLAALPAGVRRALEGGERDGLALRAAMGEAELQARSSELKAALREEGADVPAHLDRDAALREEAEEMRAVLAEVGSAVADADVDLSEEAAATLAEAAATAADELPEEGSPDLDGQHRALHAAVCALLSSEEAMGCLPEELVERLRHLSETVEVSDDPEELQRQVDDLLLALLAVQESASGEALPEHLRKMLHDAKTQGLGRRGGAAARRRGESGATTGVTTTHDGGEEEEEEGEEVEDVTATAATAALLLRAEDVLSDPQSLQLSADLIELLLTCVGGGADGAADALSALRSRVTELQDALRSSGVPDADGVCEQEVACDAAGLRAQHRALLRLAATAKPGLLPEESGGGAAAAEDIAALLCAASAAAAADGVPEELRERVRQASTAESLASHGTAPLEDALAAVAEHPDVPAEVRAAAGAAASAAAAARLLALEDEVLALREQVDDAWAAAAVERLVPLTATPGWQNVPEGQRREIEALLKEGDSLSVRTAALLARELPQLRDGDASLAERVAAIRRQRAGSVASGAAVPSVEADAVQQVLSRALTSPAADSLPEELRARMAALVDADPSDPAVQEALRALARDLLEDGAAACLPTELLAGLTDGQGRWRDVYRQQTVDRAVSDQVLARGREAEALAASVRRAETLQQGLLAALCGGGSGATQLPAELRARVRGLVDADASAVPADALSEAAAEVLASEAAAELTARERACLTDPEGHGDLWKHLVARLAGGRTAAGAALPPAVVEARQLREGLAAWLVSPAAQDSALKAEAERLVMLGDDATLAEMRRAAAAVKAAPGYTGDPRELDACLRHPDSLSALAADLLAGTAAAEAALARERAGGAAGTAEGVAALRAVLRAHLSAPGSAETLTHARRAEIEALLEDGGAATAGLSPAELLQALRAAAMGLSLEDAELAQLEDPAGWQAVSRRLLAEKQELKAELDATRAAAGAGGGGQQVTVPPRSHTSDTGALTDIQALLEEKTELERVVGELTGLTVEGVQDLDSGSWQSVALRLKAEKRELEDRLEAMAAAAAAAAAAEADTATATSVAAAAVAAPALRHREKVGALEGSIHQLLGAIGQLEGELGDDATAAAAADLQDALSDALGCTGIPPPLAARLRALVALPPADAAEAAARLAELQAAAQALLGADSAALPRRLRESLEGLSTGDVGGELKAQVAGLRRALQAAASSEDDGAAASPLPLPPPPPAAATTATATAVPAGAPAGAFSDKDSLAELEALLREKEAVIVNLELELETLSTLSPEGRGGGGGVAECRDSALQRATALRDALAAAAAGDLAGLPPHLREKVRALLAKNLAALSPEELYAAMGQLRGVAETLANSGVLPASLSQTLSSALSQEAAAAAAAAAAAGRGASPTETQTTTAGDGGGGEQRALLEAAVRAVLDSGAAGHLSPVLHYRLCGLVQRADRHVPPALGAGGRGEEEAAALRLRVADLEAKANVLEGHAERSRAVLARLKELGSMPGMPEASRRLINAAIASDAAMLAASAALAEEGGGVGVGHSNGGYGLETQVSELTDALHAVLECPASRGLPSRVLRRVEALCGTSAALGGPPLPDRVERLQEAVAAVHDSGAVADQFPEWLVRRLERLVQEAGADRSDVLLRTLDRLDQRVQRLSGSSQRADTLLGAVHDIQASAPPGALPDGARRVMDSLLAADVAAAQRLMREAEAAGAASAAASVGEAGAAALCALLRVIEARFHAGEGSAVQLAEASTAAAGLRSAPGVVGLCMGGVAALTNEALSGLRARSGFEPAMELVADALRAAEAAASTAAAARSAATGLSLGARAGHLSAQDVGVFAARLQREAALLPPDGAAPVRELLGRMHAVAARQGGVPPGEAELLELAEEAAAVAGQATTGGAPLPMAMPVPLPMPIAPAAAAAPLQQQQQHSALLPMSAAAPPVAQQLIQSSHSMATATMPAAPAAAAAPVVGVPPQHQPAYGAQQEWWGRTGEDPAFEKLGDVAFSPAAAAPPAAVPAPAPAPPATAADLQESLTRLDPQVTKAVREALRSSGGLPSGVRADLARSVAASQGCVGPIACAAQAALGAADAGAAGVGGRQLLEDLAGAADRRAARLCGGVCAVLRGRVVDGEAETLLRDSVACADSMLRELCRRGGPAAAGALRGADGELATAARAAAADGGLPEQTRRVLQASVRDGVGVAVALDAALSCSGLARGTARVVRETLAAQRGPVAGLAAQPLLPSAHVLVPHAVRAAAGRGGGGGGEALSAALSAAQDRAGTLERGVAAALRLAALPAAARAHLQHLAAGGGSAGGGGDGDDDGASAAGESFVPTGAGELSQPSVLEGIVAVLGSAGPDELGWALRRRLEALVGIVRPPPPRPLAPPATEGRGTTQVVVLEPPGAGEWVDCAVEAPLPKGRYRVRVGDVPPGHPAGRFSGKQLAVAQEHLRVVYDALPKPALRATVARAAATVEGGGDAVVDAEWGVVVDRLEGEDSVAVRWADSGGVEHCRWGRDGAYDVVLVAPAPSLPAGTRVCAAAEGSSGMRQGTVLPDPPAGGSGDGLVAVRWDRGVVSQHRWADRGADSVAVLDAGAAAAAAADNGGLAAALQSALRGPEADSLSELARLRLEALLGPASPHRKVANDLQAILEELNVAPSTPPAASMQSAAAAAAATSAAASVSTAALGSSGGSSSEWVREAYAVVCGVCEGVVDARGSLWVLLTPDLAARVQELAARPPPRDGGGGRVSGGSGGGGGGDGAGGGSLPAMMQQLLSPSESGIMEALREMLDSRDMQLAEQIRAMAAARGGRSGAAAAATAGVVLAAGVGEAGVLVCREEAAVQATPPTRSVGVGANLTEALERKLESEREKVKELQAELITTQQKRGRSQEYHAPLQQQQKPATAKKAKKKEDPVLPKPDMEVCIFFCCVHCGCALPSPVARRTMPQTYPPPPTGHRRPQGADSCGTRKDSCGGCASEDSGMHFLTAKKKNMQKNENTNIPQPPPNRPTTGSTQSYRTRWPTPPC